MNEIISGWLLCMATQSLLWDRGRFCGASRIEVPLSLEKDLLEPWEKILGRTLACGVPRDGGL